MKKILLLSALFLAVGLTVQSQQIQNINQSTGMITLCCNDYTNNVHKIWNVNIGQNKKVKIQYGITTEEFYDYVSVYSISASGAATLLFKESGGYKYGMVYSAYATGQIRVEFKSEGSLASPQYFGFELDFWPDDRTTFSGPINGNLAGGALRVQTTHGYLDLGPQNTSEAHLSTDRSRFLLNKPLFLQTGTLSAYSTSNMYFQTNGTSRMTILNTNGNVGIGTTAPTQKLEVNGTIKANALTGTGTGGILRIQTTSGYLDLGAENTSWAHFRTDRANFYFDKPIYLNNGILSSYGSSNLSLRTNGTDRITVLNSNGNVGIGTGTTSPSHKLTVNGDISVGLYRGSTVLPYGYANKIDFGNFENSDPLWISRYNKAADQSELRIRIGDDGGAGDKFSVGYERDNNWYERFIVQANGNVGIGVPIPTQKLEVNGTIRAKEVKVESTGWADYVFAPDYQLPSLETVSNHIKEHKHLPDIPSAQEVAEQGINLSEMQVKLLQKIEELTLYVIEQNKAIENLQKKNEELEDKINNQY